MTQAVKQTLFVGNWKSHKSLEEALEFVSAMQTFCSQELRAGMVLCPPFPYLPAMSEFIKKQQLGIDLGAQDISPYPLGAYTGSVAAAMVKDFCKYAIVGHSERRKYFHETNEEIARKTRSALENGLKPILCVDEPYLEVQLNFFTPSELENIVVAYEPLAAIGSGLADDPEHAATVVNKVKQLTEVEVPVLYGGSVTPENIASYVSRPEISGVLVGGASLSPESWHQLVQRGVTESGLIA